MRLYPLGFDRVTVPPHGSAVVETATAPLRLQIDRLVCHEGEGLALTEISWGAYARADAEPVPLGGHGPAVALTDVPWDPRKLPPTVCTLEAGEVMRVTVHNTTDAPRLFVAVIFGIVVDGSGNWRDNVGEG
jgi:hypothetical protein